MSLVHRALLVLALGAAALLLPPGAGADEGVRWRDLTPAQRQALGPLERDWPTLDASRKQKWLEVAARYPSLPAAEQERMQTRMTEWARMTPAERGQARLNYQRAREVPNADRQARWEAYQALPPDQRREFAARAATPPAAPARPRGAVAPDTAPPQAKSNIVPNPAYAAPPRAVGPTVVQAKPGATTSLISDRRTPPSHQQTGLPKIAATPGFVDSSTLQPRRGPQGAAVARGGPSDEPKAPKDAP